MDVTYSVVVPVYNAGPVLEELTVRTCDVFAKIGCNCEIIFVDDFSCDNSWSTLRHLAQKDRRVKAVRLAGNFGQHSATLCGMSYARGRFIITMDDDLQHRPEDIPVLIEKMRLSEAEVVITRLTGKKHAWYRTGASNVIKKLNEILMNKPKGIYLSSFRLLRRDVVRGMLQQNSPFPYLPALIFGVTDSVVNMEIPHQVRKSGSSNYTLVKMLKLAGRLLLARWPVIQGLLGTAKPAYIVDKTINIE
jgi:glycosyltransferase involved in cell wall biosynthesis